MNQNMIGRMAVIAAIILAAPAIVMTLTQQAFAQNTATAIGALAANRADVNQSTSTECTSTNAGPLTVLSISITVCKSEPPPLSSTIDQSASATNSGAVTATASSGP